MRELIISLHHVALPFEAQNRLVLLVSSRAQVLKIYLHPQGGAQSPVVRRPLSLIPRLIEQGWQPTTYDGALPLSRRRESL